LVATSATPAKLIMQGAAEFSGRGNLAFCFLYTHFLITPTQAFSYSTRYIIRPLEPDRECDLYHCQTCASKILLHIKSNMPRSGTMCYRQDVGLHDLQMNFGLTLECHMKVRSGSREPAPPHFYDDLRGWTAFLFRNAPKFESAPTRS
jgi:hypothetical protein